MTMIAITLYPPPNAHGRKIEEKPMTTSKTLRAPAFRHRNILRNALLTGALALAFTSLRPAPAHASLGDKVVHDVSRDARHVAHVTGHVAGHVARVVGHTTAHIAHRVARASVHGVRRIKADVN
jgi:hypothetical protein